MRIPVALLGLALAASAIPAHSQSLGLGEAAPSPGAQQPSPDRNHGRAVALGGNFGELRVACAACHRLDGTGDSSGAFPRLTGQVGWYLYSTLRDFADGQRRSDVMEPIARLLNDRQMQDVAAFYAGSQAEAPPPPLTQDPAAIESGRTLAESVGTGRAPTACALCHGPAGAGRAPLYPSLAGQYAPYLERQLRLFRDGQRHGDPMGVMQAVARQLSPQQIHAVAAYYASLSPGRSEAAANAAAGPPAESGTSQ